MTNQQTDILIEQVLAEPGAEPLWRQFELAANADAALWKRLAESQRDQSLLEQAMEVQVAAADAVDLPETRVSIAPIVDDLDEVGVHQGVIARIGSWTGWAVAAMVAIAWVIVAQSGTRSVSEPWLVDGGSTGAPTTGVQYVNHSPDHYLREYYRRGQEVGSVLMEMPTKTLIDTRRLPDGRIEVLFIRHVLERSDVSSLHQFGGVDEQGNGTFVPFQTYGQGEV